MDKIIKNLEAIRKDKGIKQVVIAKKLGISQAAYSNYVTRNNDISYNRLSRIADILGTSVIDIITYPRKFVDIESVAIESGDDGKVAILFEVSSKNRDMLINLVRQEKKS